MDTILWALLTLGVLVATTLTVLIFLIIIRFFA